MAGKRRQSTFEDLIEIVALFPWWIGLTLAAASYFWLHHIAVQNSEAVSFQPGQAGAAMPHVFYRGLATAGQYILPMICVIGAMVSAYGRWQRRRLHEHVAARPAASALNEMSWQEFEMLVGEAFRHKGYAVSEIGGGGADGGVDLVLNKGREKYLVQCKQWRAYKVGVPVVRELYGVMAASGAAGGFVVTSGSFTQEAVDFAVGRNIELLDGTHLSWMIRRRALPAKAEVPGVMPAAGFQCPKCGSDMVQRTAKQGSNTGKKFWGCTRFPDCRGTVEID